MVRSAFVFTYMVPIILITGGSIMNTQNIRFQILRSFLSFGTIYFTYNGYQNLPLAVAASIGGFEPIFAAFWGLGFGQESRESFYNLLPIAFLGFISVLLFSIDKSLTGGHNYLVGISSMVVANLIHSSTGYIIKDLNKTDKTITSMTYSAIFTSSTTCIILVLSAYFFEPFDFNKLKPYRFPLTIMGFLAIFSSWFNLKALRYLDPSTQIAISNLSIPLSSIVGFFIDGEKISRLGFIGAISAVFTVYLAANRKKLETSERVCIKTLTLIAYIIVFFSTLLVFLNR